MNWVIFWVLLGFFIGNMGGMALMHALYHKEHKEDGKGYWKKDGEFIAFTALFFIFGICYLILYPIMLAMRH